MAQESNTSRDIEAIYTRHVDTVYRVAYTFMGNAADTEDVVQTVFVRLIKSGKVFESTEHEKAWLINVTANYCKDVLKSSARKNVALDRAPEPATSQDAYDATLAVVLDLPERYKDAVYLYYYEGYTAAEVADILEQPPSTVRSHLSEARDILREQLKGGAA